MKILFVKPKVIIFFCLFVALNNNYLKAQIDKEFWFAAPEVSKNQDFDIPIILRISTQNMPSIVTISQPANPGFVPITVSIPAYSTNSVDLSNLIDLIESKPADNILNTGIHIVSSQDVTIFYDVVSSYCNCNPELYTLKGKNAIGNYFLIPSQTTYYNNSSYFPTPFSTFDIIATEDSTIVTIKPSNDIVGHLANLSFSLLLNKGQVYSAKAISNLAANHLQGSSVNSTKPIAITYNDDLLQGPSGCADLGGDQIIPVSLTGNEYIVAKGGLYNERVSILGTQNNTEIYLDGNSISVANIGIGQTYEFTLSNSSVYVNTNKPVYLLHTSGNGCEIGIALLPPISCSGSKKIGFTRSNNMPFYLNLIVKNGAQGSFVLNGDSTYITSSMFSAVSGSNGQWMVAHIPFNNTQIPVGTGNLITNNNSLFHMGIINGDVVSGCSYGYFSDFSSLNLGPDIVKCPTDTITLSVGSEMSSYLWSTGDTTQSIKTVIGGLYWITANRDSCILSDTILISLVNAPLVNLGNDTTLSQGSTLTLNAGNTGSTFLWSTNDTTQTINVNTSGTYWVKVTNSGGCYSSDTINVDFTTSTNTNPMNDTTICKGESVTLTANAPATGNTWEYFQDFENTVGSEWSDTNRITYNSTKELGPFCSQLINLNLSSMPAHDSVEVSFDLYIFDSWDGNDPNYKDFWSLFVNNDTIINTTFSNLTGAVQSYPQNYYSINPERTGAFLINLPNRCHPCNCFSSSIYKIVKKIPNNSNSLQIVFKGIMTQNGGVSQDICDESWGLDNVKVKLLNANTTPQYLWSTGATTASISVSPNQTTNYTVTVTNGNTTFADSATVYVLNPQINNGADTTICKGESVVLKNYNIQNNFSVNSQLLQSLQQNLIAYYPFNGNANDESGNANNGTVNGATLTTDRFGNANSAYNFNGSSASIALPNTLMSSMPAGCFSAWFKLNSIPTAGNSYVLFDKTLTFTINDFQLVINENAKLRLMMNDIYNTGNSIIFSNVTFSTNFWYNIIVSWAGNTAKIYVNNLLDTTLTNTNGFLPASNHMVNIGVGDIGTGHFDGTIDDVMIFDNSLSSSQVNQIYNNTQSTYLWSTNHTTQSITVTPNQTTTYTLTVTNGNISCMDTITVNVLNPQINNGQDTTICKGETVVLTAEGLTNQNICSKSQLPSNLQQGLVAFYPFCGKANDESGNGNNGTVNGATLTTDRFGNANSAYLFNGVNNKITADTLPILNQYFSYSCWIKINGLTPVNIQSFGGLGGPQSLNHMWNFSYNPNLSIWDLYDHTNGSWYTNWTGQTSSSTLNWTNVTIVYNNVTEYLYVNGTLLNQRTIVTPIQTFADRTLRLSEIGNQFFNGKIDDILIYNRVLSVSEISQIYNLGASTYLWSTNDTTQSITVTPNQTTTYTLSVTNGNISCLDTIKVNVLNPQINNGQDTTICKGETVVLTAQTSSQNACNKSQLPPNLQQGLVVYYPFCGNANDESGNVNHGIINGAILTTDRFGNANSAYSFDGIDDFIVTNNGSVGNFLNDGTVSVWFYTDSSIFNFQEHWIIAKDNGPYWMLLYFSDDSLRMNMYPFGINGGSVISKPSILANSWHNVIFTKNAQFIKIYFDGTLILDSIGSIGGIYNNDPICIGKSFYWNGYYFKGFIDDIAVYNRAITPNEVQQLYNIGGYSNTSVSYLWSTNDTTQSITVTPNQTTTYTLTVTNGNISCMDTITVNVINIDAGLNDSICKGDSVQLQASGGLIYNWTPITGLSNPNIANPYAHPNQTTTYTVNAQGQVPNLIYNGDFELGNVGFYSDYIFTLPINNTANQFWITNNSSNWSPYFYSCNDHTTGYGKMMVVNGSTNANNIVWKQNVIVKPNTAYIFSAWIQNIYQTISSDDLAKIQLKINNNPIGLIFQCQSNQCLWTNLNITWNSGNDTIAVIAIRNQNILAGGNDFALDDIYFSELKTCSDTVKVTVVNPTQINLGNDTTICQGQSKTLAVGSGYTSYIWSTGATTQQITVQNTGTYWVKAISNQGCTVSDTINLTFLPVQSNIIRDTILCLGQSVIYNPGAGYTNHLWSTGATTASLNVNLPGTFWLQVKQPNGCVIKDTAIVKYDSLNIVVSSFTNPTCYGGNNGSINTTTTGLYPNYTYSWNTTPVINTANISNRTAGNYTVTVTDSKGCTKSVSKTLTAPNPVAVSLGNDTAICQGQNLNLQATQVFTSYLWSTGATTQSINVIAQGTYWLKGTNSSGCSGYDTINITVNPVPLIQIVPANPNICKGDSVTLQASSNIAGTTFNWSNGNNSSSITVSPLATVNYTVIGSKNACKDTATVTVTVNPVPVVTISPANPSVCKGEAVTLTASSNLANTTFLWNNSSANTTINVSPNTNTNYFVVGSLSTCKDTAFVTVTTKPLPVLNVTADKNPICEGETVKLTANSDIPATTYVWSNTSTAGFINVSPVSTSYYYVTGTASNCHDTAGINIVVISKQSIDLGEDRYLCAGDEVNLTAGNLTGTYLWSNGSNSGTLTLTEPGVYWLRVDNNGCIASDTIEMKKCSEIWVPNVFTPNGDGTNEIFKPVTTEIQKLTMYIYNRWGEMIFETSDVNGGWDGKLHGNDVPTGVYFWLIRYNENRSSALNIEKEIKGSVTLLR